MFHNKLISWFFFTFQIVLTEISITNINKNVSFKKILKIQKKIMAKKIDDQLESLTVKKRKIQM